MSGLMAMVFIASAVVTPTMWAEEERTLAHLLPNDVFLYVHETKNPERAFLDGYWGEVFSALAESGLEEDAIDLIGTLIGLAGGDGMDEFMRLKERAQRLIDGVDWEGLGGGESVFAERFPPVINFSEKKPPIMMPQMVIILRGTPGGAEKNFEGLSAILDAMADEINKAAGRELLVVERKTWMGAKVAGINLLGRLPGAPSMPITLALRDDLVLIGVRDGLIDDVLAFLDGSSKKKALADDKRFQAGFAMLPEAEDYMTFFDMQSMLHSLRTTADVLVRTLSGPNDVTLHADMGANINGLAGKAVAAYQSGDYQKALALVGEAHKIDPKNSVILYNLACFNACAGNKDEALTWLAKAIEGGFHAPRKISSDADLFVLHDEPRYEQLLDRAAELALKVNVHDIVLNESKDKDVISLRMQIGQACEQRNYEQALKLAEKASAVAPSDSRVLYCLGFLHALLGNGDKGLHFLEKAVDGGYYCPNHIARDPDWASVRSTERFQAALAKAREKAAGLAMTKVRTWANTANRLIDRIGDNVGFLDYVAGVERTDTRRRPNRSPCSHRAPRTCPFTRSSESARR